MGIKSLAVASIGLLKRGILKTLSFASIGLLHKEEEEKKAIRKNAGNLMIQPGIANFDKYNVQSNNIAIILAETGVF